MKFGNPFFKPRNLIPMIGTMGWLMIYNHKLRIERELKGEIVQRVIEHLRHNPEVMEAFGYDFRLKTNILTSLMTSVSFKGPFGDGHFQVRTPKGIFAVTFNTSSQTYENILKSPKPALAKAKYDIPDQKLIDKMNAIANTSADGKKQLEETPMIPQTRFWAIDYINVDQKKGFKRGNQSAIVIKPSSQPVSPSTNQDYTNLYSLYSDLQAASADKKIAPQLTFTDPQIQTSISNFRMREPYDKRMQLFSSVFYFGLLGTFWYLKAKPQFRIVPVSHSVLFNTSCDMIRKKFVFDNYLLFNSSSIGGSFEDFADYYIQFTGSHVQGTARFKINHLERGTWEFESASVQYTELGSVQKLESIMDLAPKKNLFWHENPKLVTRKLVTHA